MNRRTRFLIVLSLLAAAGAWLFWPRSGVQTIQPGDGGVAATPRDGGVAATLNTNKLAFRLANTTRSIKQLETTPHAILLANAFIDTEKPLDLKIPAHLRAGGNPGAYIVQARGVTDARFRAALAAAGAQIVSYIPNNAYLVRVAAKGAGALAGNALVQAVLPYEPYYKIQSSLLGLAVDRQPLPPGTALNLGLFAADAATAEAQIAKLGAKIIGRDRSAFGPVLRVLAPADWLPLAQVPGVQILEPAHARMAANDLSRVTVGVATDTITTTNYDNLDGHNVLVAVNDTGIDAQHPDLIGRVLNLLPIDLTDTNGHGTHIAGIIAGDGTESMTVTTAEGSIMPGTNGQFRGKAPKARLFSIGSYNSDYVLQTNAARVGALISNNSWDYGNGDPTYDLAAASYDAATRDALPFTTGSQPVLFVFAAGNDGYGDNNGAQGNADTILSPGTAKNVITVGALEQPRNITNWVTYADGTSNQYWASWTDSGTEVAWYSSRGNVGIGTEGNYGRFKPDVVSPGTFVVSTSSQFNHEWDTNAYYNPTNVDTTFYPAEIVDTNSLNASYRLSVPASAVAVVITITPNKYSPNPFPGDLPIYVKQSATPTTNSGGYDFVTTKDGVSIPPDGGAGYLQQIQNTGIHFAVGNNTNIPVNYSLTVQVFSTNNVDNHLAVLEDMNDKLSLGQYYRYESGTSLAAADVSGVLALIQDYFTNQFSPPLTPSPALLKALLINGARSVTGYALALTNSINFQGWGLDNIQNSVPVGGLVNQFSQPGSSFFVEQNPTNALATGDSHTFIVTIDTRTFAQYLPLQATLVWTDPPGDPAAAIKLVNNLDLVITNLDTGEVYFGNDFSGQGGNQPWDTNGPPNLDFINNVENILLAVPLASRYSVTVVGRAVNVNAVTAQTNNAAGLYEPNVVQDYALVISIGEGEIINAFSSVTDNPIASNPTGDQNITVVTTTNSPLFNQIAGASSPLLGTNSLPLGTNTIWGPNGVVTVGQTNQWHFYIVTNTGPQADYTNAAFITFDATTLSVPRMGVYEDTIANATRPEADIDLYVTLDSSITNLNPVAISNCLAGANNSRASLTQGGTEFVFYTNSVSVAASGGPSVYYVGVKSEDRMGAEYAFMPIFTSTPFSHLDENGNQIVRGLLLPINIPGGTVKHPAETNVFALAVMPMVVQKVTVTNLVEHTGFGNLLGAVTFGGKSVVLNNHDSLGNTFGTLPRVYDDSRNKPLGTTNTDGPGSLVDYRRKSALGPWILSEISYSQSFTGRVTTFDLVIQPHRDLKQPGVIVAVPPGGWFIDYVDVPAGYTNLTFFATNVTVPVAFPPIQMYEKFGNDPTLADYDQRADLTNGVPPGNTISIGPPLAQGQYFVGLYNPGNTEQSVFISATLGIDASVNNIYNFNSTSGQMLADDAVTAGSVITVPNTVTQLVASVTVGMVVNSPRVSDYTFTLVSPTGERALLMENRGAGTTNLGHLSYTTNFFGQQTAGGFNGDTNVIPLIKTSGILIVDYDFFTFPDNLDVFYDGVNIFHSGLVSFTGRFTIPYGPGLSTNLFMVMDGPGSGALNTNTAWNYTPTVVSEDLNYLTFTDDTNLAQVPIKFGIPPFDVKDPGTNYSFSDFELATNGDYLALTNIYDAFGGWTVPTNRVTYATVLTNISGTNLLVTVTNVVYLTNNLVSVATDTRAAQAGSNYLALGSGSISRVLPFTVGRKYQVTFGYRGPGIAGWWRGEGNGSDSSDPENNGNNGTLVGRFNYPAGVVGQAFQFEDPGDTYQFAGTNTYVQVPASASLNVGAGGGFTIEGWINPTNLARPQPLVEWLAHVPTNTAVTNIVIVQGPVLNPATGHYYYLLAATNWTTSETWARQLGGHLVTFETANEDNWVYDTFTAYGTLNRDLWIGLTNSGPNTAFRWASGLTSTYTNWMPGQPGVIVGDNYTAILGPTNTYPGLWRMMGNNRTINKAQPTLPVYGVVEVNDIPTNGVQLWISGTNWTPGLTNILKGCLYANIVDTNYVSHEIFSAPGLLTNNVYQHVALTYNTNSGIAALYLNGTNVATTNLGVFVPKTDGDLLLGWDMSRYTNNFYAGKMDEMSIYARALSLAEISAIYRISVPSTNGSGNTNGLIGKFDPTIIPPLSLAKFRVSLGAEVKTLYSENSRWLLNGFTFTADTNSLPLEFTGLEPGVLLDSMSVSEAAQGNLYYLPEQELAALTGSSAFGNWTLQVWDNRAGAYVTNLTQIVTWQLSLVLVSNAVVSASLPPQTPVTTTVPSGQIVYYSVTVPEWAHVATNILVSSSLPVDLYFNQTNPPTGSNPNDYTLLTAATSGSGFPSLVTNGTPPLLPLLTNQTYYLGVRNTNIHAATVVLEVDYDIVALTNGAPFTGVLNTNEYNSVRYFQFEVSSNASEATFQLLKLSGNADLVVHKGAPLPTLLSSDYGSFSVTNLDENIYVLTNSAPVPLSAGRWYLGVFKRGSGLINFSVLAKELDPTNGVPARITLTNGVPFNWTAGPGAALTNFFRFAVTNRIVNGITNLGLRFELYNLSGNGDLTVQTNALPLAPPFYQTSQNGGRNPELIFVYTNSALTNLVADWYLGVPNREVTNLTYTIIAVFQTNLYFPAFPDAQGAGRGTLGGRLGDVYHVTTTSDSGPGSLRAAVNSTNRTVVFDIGGNINLLSPLVITNSYLTIAGQTAPGGVTVAGSVTTVQSAHDVIIRDVRFRSGTGDDSFQFLNASNVIADHISASWSANNLVSVLNCSNVTVQWSLMSDSVYNPNSPAGIGSLLRQGAGTLSFHHNLYADNYSGSPRLGDNLTLDFVNNVIYNWGVRSGLTGGTNDLDYSTDGCTNRLNYVCNYLIAGPDTAIFATNNYSITNIAFFGGLTNALAANWIFQTNNFIDSDTNRVLNGANTDWRMFTNKYTRFDRPFPVPPVPVDEAFIAYERVLDFAGVSLMQRDPVDTNIVTNVRNQNGRVVSSLPPTPAMVAWWKAENNYLDSAGLNHGTPENGTNLFAPGEVGQAFAFNGSKQYVAVTNATPSLNVGAGAGFTIEGWIYPTNVSQLLPIAQYQQQLQFSFVGGVTLQISNPTNNTGNIYANIVDTTGFGHPLISSSGIVTNGGWQHVALTYDKASGTTIIYLNGTNVAQSSFAGITPQTSYSYFLIGASTLGGSAASPTFDFAGSIDELTVYNYALSSNAIASIYNLGGAGKPGAPVPAAVPIYLDTDQDGIPDFWETTFGTGPFTPSNNNDRDGDGFTDLEEYNDWLAVPHALTVTNTPVGIDLYQLCGNSGHLAFFVTNSVHGLVYLTNILGSVTNTVYFSNSFAIFMPTNSAGTNFYGYASFGVYVTNLDTAAYFGSVPVSVVVSARPIAINSNMPPVIHELNSGVASNLCNAGGSDFYHITVTTNDFAAVFELDNRTGPMSLVVRYGLPLPSLSSYDYYTNAPAPPATEQIAVLTNSTPVPLAPGDWYMAAVNVSGSNVCYSALITKLSNILPPLFLFPTNTTVTNIMETVTNTITCVATDLDSPPLPLTFALVGGPPGLSISNNVIFWTPTETQGPSTNTVVVSVSNGAFSVTNSFTINVLESNLPPAFVLTNIPNQILIVPPGLFVLTNAATDPDIPVNPLTYTLFSTVTGPNTPVINNTNGVITWTATPAQVGTNYLFTTVVTDTNPWAVNQQSFSVTNNFNVLVLSGLPPGGPETNVVGSNSINWFAIRVPTNAIYATNTLIFATLPVNLWFSTNAPPSITNAADAELLLNRTNGISVLSTNLATAPTNIVPGGIYFLGVQNTNSVAVTNAIRVDFALAIPAPVLPFIPVQVITAGDTLTVTNTATDASTNAALVYYLTNSPAGAGISTNGIITWITTTNLAPTNVVITTFVTDTNANLSATNSFLVIVLPGLVHDQPQTNVVGPHGINWFVVNVPTNADFATNILRFATAPVNLWFSTNLPPSITNAADFEMLANSLGGAYVINTNAAPRLVPGSSYFLGVQNTNNIAATNTVEVDFHLVFPAAANIVIFSIIHTNISGSNGFLVTWFAPTNDQFHLQWSPSLAPQRWTNFNGVISFTSFITATNSQFQYFDDGSQTGGFGPTRFYRLLLLDSPTNTAPFFPNTPAGLNAAPLLQFVFNDAAKDWDVPAQTLTYSLTNSLTGTNVAVINPGNGVISWTPDASQVGLTDTITVTVTDNGVPAKSATHSFNVTVNPMPAFSSITVNASGVHFQWTAPASEQFQIRWTTNLLSPINWHLFPDIITSGTGIFTFVDTNTPLLMKFYQLILLP